MAQNSSEKPTKTQKQDNNVLRFSKQNATMLSENEINSLFLGFVNLIKRNVVFEKERQYKVQITGYHKQISGYLLELEKKNQEIELLKQTLAKLQKAN